MSSTAALVGVFGTVQSKCFSLGSRSPVIHVNVVPPSSDRRISVSHHDRSTYTSGNTDFHSTLTTCPGIKTSPALGEISSTWYLDPLGSADAVLNDCGAKANVNANSAMMNRWVFILSVDPSWRQLSMAVLVI